MGVIADKMIKKLVEEGKLLIEPFHEDGIEPASYDLRMGDKILISPVEGEKGRVVDLRKEKENKYKVKPGQFVSVLTEERLALPNNISGRFGLRSEFTRKGLVSFGGIQVDPGWRGRLVISLLNVGPEAIELDLGKKTFTIEFHKLVTPAEEAYSGDYQDQLDIPSEDASFIAGAKTISLAELTSMKDSVTLLRKEVDLLKKRMEFQVWRDPFAIPLNKFRALTDEEHLYLAEKAYALCKNKIQEIFRERHEIMEVLICDGEVVHTSNEVGGIDKDVIDQLAVKKGKPWYIFAREDMIEESPWVRLDNDFYPTVQLFLGHKTWKDKEIMCNGRKTVADFDTGNPYEPIFDEALGEGIISPPAEEEFRYGRHLGRIYRHFLRDVKIGVEDVNKNFRGKILGARFVSLWKESPFTIINPRRESFVGRRLMFDFNMNVTLNSKSKTSKVRYAN